LNASTTSLIRYYRYIYRNDTSPAATPAEYHSTASAAITVLPALGADHGVVTIQDTLGYKRYFSVPLSAGNPATVTVSGMEAGVATFNIKLMVSGTTVTDGNRKYSLPKNQVRSVAFPESGPSPTYPLAQIARVLLTQANQNDEGTGVLIAGRKAKLQAFFCDPQNRAGYASVNARVSLPNGGSQVLPLGTNGSSYFTNQEVAPDSFAMADVPPELVQPGAIFTIEARLSDGTVLGRTYAPNIRPGKRITVHVFEVSPGPGYSGVPVARDAGALRDQVVRWVEAVLPIAGIDIDIRPGFPWFASDPPSP
jgi:hypothetical protein